MWQVLIKQANGWLLIYKIAIFIILSIISVNYDFYLVFFFFKIKGLKGVERKKFTKLESENGDFTELPLQAKVQILYEGGCPEAR